MKPKTIKLRHFPDVQATVDYVVSELLETLGEDRGCDLVEMNRRIYDILAVRDLIEAAPKMQAALTECLIWLTSNEDQETGVFQRAHAALAESKGEKP